jgi:hypothetical protein
MTSPRRTINHWRKRSRKNSEGREICAHGWAEYSKSGYTNKSSLHVQCNSHQNSKDIYHRLKNLPYNAFGNTKTVNSQGNTEQKKQCWRYHNTQLQTILQTHSNKNSIVLAQKQTWRPVEQNREPGYESLQLCLPYFWQKCQKHMMEKRQPLQ